MRHFLRSDLGPKPIAVPSLTCRLELSRPMLGPVRCAGSAHRLAPSRRAALSAEPLPPIATTAETKLNLTPLAEREPVLGRGQSAPCRRFLDMEREPW